MGNNCGNIVKVITDNPYVVNVDKVGRITMIFLSPEN
jgi:hypothetical protein